MIRPAVPEEHAFVKSSWLQSYASSDWALLCTPRTREHVETAGCGHAALKSHRVRGMTVWHTGDAYWRGHRGVIDRLLASCNVSVFVIDEPMVDGFVVRDRYQPVLHYVYTRASARMRGVARSLVADLLAAPSVTYTHASRHLDRAQLPAGWAFDPYGAFR
jgi:hypothetical protein